MPSLVECAEPSRVHEEAATDESQVLAAVVDVSLFPARLMLDEAGSD